ncbi:MAG: ribosomal protein S18-alanine N-acetyltransferase [Oscillospiraceae bacterium]
MQKDNIHILPIGLEQVSEVTELEKKYFSDPWSEKSILADIGSPTGFMAAAVYENSIIGYLFATKVLGEISLNKIAVAENFRRNHVAEMLLKWLETEVFPMEFITLEVRESNQAAKKLYEKNGYKIVGNRKNFYENPTENAILMTKFFTQE